MAFLKFGDNQKITNVIQTDELTDEQKKLAKKISKDLLAGKETDLSILEDKKENN